MTRPILLIQKIVVDKSRRVIEGFFAHHFFRKFTFL